MHIDQSMFCHILFFTGMFRPLLRTSS